MYPRESVLEAPNQVFVFPILSFYSFIEQQLKSFPIRRSLIDLSNNAIMSSLEGSPMIDL